MSRVFGLTNRSHSERYRKKKLEIKEFLAVRSFFEQEMKRLIGAVRPLNC